MSKKYNSIVGDIVELTKEIAGYIQNSANATLLSTIRFVYDATRARETSQPPVTNANIQIRSPSQKFVGVLYLHSQYVVNSNDLLPTDSDYADDLNSVKTALPIIRTASNILALSTLSATINSARSGNATSFVVSASLCWLFSSQAVADETKVCRAIKNEYFPRLHPLDQATEPVRAVKYTWRYR